MPIRVFCERSLLRSRVAPLYLLKLRPLDRGEAHLRLSADRHQKGARVEAIPCLRAIRADVAVRCWRYVRRCYG